MPGALRRVQRSSHRYHARALAFIVATLLPISALAAIVEVGEILVAGHHGFDAVDPETGAIRRVLETSDIGWNLDVAVAGDGTLYFIGSDDLKRVDPVTGALSIVNPALATNQPHQLHFDPDGNLLATGTSSLRWDGTTRTDPATGASEVAFASSFDACGDGTPYEIPEGFPWFPPPGWDPPILPLCMPLQNHDLIGQSMDPDGTLVVGSRPRGLTTYEEGVYRVDLFTGEIEAIALSWDSDLRKIRDVVVAHDRTIYAAIFNESEPAGNSCFEDCTQIIAIDPDTGATSVLAILNGVPGSISEMEMDRAGNIIIMSRQGHLVRLNPTTGAWDVITDQLNWNSIGIAIYGMVQSPLSASLAGAVNQAAAVPAVGRTRGWLLAGALLVAGIAMTGRLHRHTTR